MKSPRPDRHAGFFMPCGRWEGKAGHPAGCPPGGPRDRARRSIARPVVVIGLEDAVRIAFGVVILPGTQRPEEGGKAKPAQKQRYRNKIGQNIHHFTRKAFSETLIEDSDIASAAASGVASPTSASGTATTF